MEDVVYVDVESIKTNVGGLAFSVTLKKVRMWESGDHEILITRTFLNKDTIHYAREHDQTMCKKIAHTIGYIHEHGEPDAIFTNTRQMLEKMTDFIDRHGRVWVGHALDRDLGFLYDTDTFFKSEFFIVHPCGNDQVCTLGYKWGRISKVCTQCIIPKRAPNFYKMYGNGSLTLENLMKFCIGDDQHQHISPSDVDHLIQVIEYIRNKDAQTFYFGTMSTYIHKL